VLLKCKNVAKYATYVLNGRGFLLQITLYSASMSSEKHSLNFSLQIASISHIQKKKKKPQNFLFLFFFLGTNTFFFLVGALLSAMQPIFSYFNYKKHKNKLLILVSPLLLFFMSLRVIKANISQNKCLDILNKPCK